LIHRIGLQTQRARTRIPATDGRIFGRLNTSRLNFNITTARRRIDALCLRLAHTIIRADLARVLVIAFHPETTNTTFDHGSRLLASQARERFQFGARLRHLARIHHIVACEMIAIAKTLRFEHTPDHFRSAVRTGVPEFRARVVLFADRVLATVLQAADLLHPWRTVGGFLTLINEIVLDNSIVEFRRTDLDRRIRAW